MKDVNGWIHKGRFRRQGTAHPCVHSVDHDTDVGYAVGFAAVAADGFTAAGLVGDAARLFLRAGERLWRGGIRS